MQFYRVRLHLRQTLLGVAFLYVCAGCAVLHHVQVGQVDDRGDDALIPFEVKVSETGINTEELKGMAKATRSRAGDDAANIAAIIALFQMGPRTGNPVYDQKYAERVIYKIHEACPSGQVTGLTSIREMRKYPAISGEIVKVSGYCRKPRQAAMSSVRPVNERK